jgi:UDP-glucose 4-epimerase
MKKVIIIGGAGFIGSCIVKNLLKRSDYQITIVDNFSRGKDRLDLLDANSKHEFLKIINIDLTDYKEFSKLETDYDYVYVLAAMVGVDKVNSLPHEVIRVNSLIVVNTLEWLKSSHCNRVVFTSTSETYAGTVESFDAVIPTPENIPLTISDIAHPRFTYAVTKMLGESGFLNYASKGYFDAVIVRYHNVYGPMMGFRHVIPHLAERFLAGENPFMIYGHNQTRAFNFVDDAVEGTILATENGRSGEIYHIGDSEEISIETLVKFVGNIFNYNGNYEYSDTFPGSVSRRCPDISKARKDFGYSPKVDWKSGVTLTIKWYKDYLLKSDKKNESFYDQYGIKS